MTVVTSAPLLRYTEVMVPKESIPDGSKLCPSCGEVKPLGEFPVSNRNKDGRYSYCRGCNTSRMSRWVSENPDKAKRTRMATKLRKYGLTSADYDRMLEKQQGRCDLCGTDEPGHVPGMSFTVDHDHDTGRVRGLLCQPCNMGLGKFGDSLDILRKAVAYLERQSV